MGFLAFFSGNSTPPRPKKGGDLPPRSRMRAGLARAAEWAENAGRSSWCSPSASMPQRWHLGRPIAAKNLTDTVTGLAGDPSSGPVRPKIFLLAAPPPGRNTRNG